MNGDEAGTPGDLPQVGSPAAKPGVARAGEGNGRQRMRADLDRIWTDGLLARVDTGSTLARDLQAMADLHLPLPAEIELALSRVEAEAGISEQRIEEMLSLDRVGDITVEGLRLNELLDRSGAETKEREMLRRGLVFLKQKMYAEAAEWWTLHCPSSDGVNHRQYLLLTLLLALTYRLSGNEPQATGALEQVRRIRRSDHALGGE